MKRFVLGISGATGPVLGARVLTELLGAAEVHLIVSANAREILLEESAIDWTGGTPKEAESRIRKYLKGMGVGAAGLKRLSVHDEHDMGSPVASGSYPADGMLVVPCSMKSLSGIASGYANTLIERAADVTIKEGRLLVISPRETPLSAIHLENMLKLARLGVRIVPPMIGLYHQPGTGDDIMDFAAGKVLDSAGVRHNLYKRWTGRK